VLLLKLQKLTAQAGINALPVLELRFRLGELGTAVLQTGELLLQMLRLGKLPLKLAFGLG
jgi:hypothetical protein